MNDHPAIEIDPDQTYVPEGSVAILLETNASTDQELDVATDAVLGALRYIAPEAEAAVGGRNGDSRLSIVFTLP
jgi:hypothetical protein